MTITYETLTCDVVKLNDELNGAMTLGPFLNTGLPVGGKTVIFTTPAKTITFAGALGSILTLKQIGDALTDAVTGIVGSSYELRPAPIQNSLGVAGNTSWLVFRTDSVAAISKDGTANADLRLSTSVATDIKGPMDQADIIAICNGVAAGHYLLVRHV